MANNYVYIWEYQVHPEFINQFEKAYHSKGEWVKLFKKSDGHLKTELIKDRSDATRYITIDSWKSFELYQKFLNNFGFEFRNLDKKCEEFTVKEKKIGEFSNIK